MREQKDSACSIVFGGIDASDFKLVFGLWWCVLVVEGRGLVGIICKLSQMRKGGQIQVVNLKPKDYTGSRKKND